MTRIAVVIVAVLAGCARLPDPRDPRVEVVDSATAIAPDRELRFVELNTHGQPGEIIADAIEHDPMLRDADVLVLTEIHRADEVGCSAACVVARTLGYASVYAPGHAEPAEHGGHDGGYGDGGVAILARAQIDAPRVIELPEFNIHVARERRIGLTATLVRAGASPIAVYAIHLENRLTPRERQHQLQPILDDASAREMPVIIAGDVNTSPFSWLAHVFPIPTGTQGAKLERFVRAHGFDTPVTASGATSRFLQMRVDAIYTRGMTTHSYAVAEAEDVSDHLALVARLQNK
ncbi:MAG TPA: endonuclease/exonuclease/phosphatase family protein [Kofleriaceae bacterium]|jgi:endonuclease/exonuclease/phosphatase family metal-dependent hydrolase